MIRLGLHAKLYRNTGSYVSPSWNEVSNVKDLTLNLESGEADVTTRGNAGWRATVGTLKDASVEFQMLWDAADEDFTAVQNAFLTNLPIECAIMSGPMNDSESKGLRAFFAVLKFTRSEALEEAIQAEVTMKPTVEGSPPIPPQWISGSGS